ncbi:hypothetical protein [Methanosphaera sp.]
MGKYPTYISYFYGKYQIIKWLNGKTIYFGSFNTLEEAITERDHLIKHNWDKEYSKYYQQQEESIHRNPKKYIHYDGWNYKIYKNVRGKLRYFGGYTTLEEAITMRNYFIDNEWDTSLVQYKRKHHPQNPISKNIQHVHGKYILSKYIDGQQQHIGTYDTLEEAVRERTFWEEINWDIDKIDLY